MTVEEFRILVAFMVMILLMILGNSILHHIVKEKYPVAKAGGDSKGDTFKYRSIWNVKTTTGIKRKEYKAYIVDGNSMGKKNIIDNDIILVREKEENDVEPIGKVVLCKGNVLRQYKEGMDYLGVIEYMYRF